MKNKIITYILIFAIVFTSFPKNVKGKNYDFSSRENDLVLNSISAVLIDGSNGRILYGKSPFDKRAMASTTKIMTCIIALEKGNLNDIVTVSRYAQTMPNVKMGIKEGEKYKLKDLLYGLMLESYNDVAVAIAEHISGSVEEFAKVMNNKAKELGMKQTNFVTPNGLDENNHYSTAYDMALIGAYAIRNQLFLDITNTREYKIKEINGKNIANAINKDAFLDMMDGAIGIKTGFTGDAGYCFVGAIRKGENVFVSVVLGAGWPPNKNYKWQDTKSLMKYGETNYKLTRINHKNWSRKIKVNEGVSKNVNVGFNMDYACQLSKYDDLEIMVKMKEEVDAPIKQNEKVGEVFVIINGEVITKRNIKTLNSVKKIDYGHCIKKILNVFLMEVR